MQPYSPNLLRASRAFGSARRNGRANIQQERLNAGLFKRDVATCSTHCSHIFFLATANFEEDTANELSAESREWTGPAASIL